MREGGKKNFSEKNHIGAISSNCNEGAKKTKNFRVISLNCNEGANKNKTFGLFHQILKSAK